MSKKREIDLLPTVVAEKTRVNLPETEKMNKNQ